METKALTGDYGIHEAEKSSKFDDDFQLEHTDIVWCVIVTEGEE